MRAILKEVLQEGDMVVTERESITILGLLGDRKRVYHHLHLASNDRGRAGKGRAGKGRGIGTGGDETRASCRSGAGGGGLP